MAYYKNLDSIPPEARIIREISGGGFDVYFYGDDEFIKAELENLESINALRQVDIKGKTKDRINQSAPVVNQLNAIHAALNVLIKMVDLKSLTLSDRNDIQSFVDISAAINKFRGSSKKARLSKTTAENFEP